MALRSFVEERLVLCIDYGARGGPSFDTGVVTTRSGMDYRNVNWPEAKGRWEVGNQVVTKEELKLITDFFHRRRGAAIGFRWKDWSEYELTRVPMVQISPVEYQVVKLYGADDVDKYQVEIEKVVPGSVQLIANNTPLIFGWSVSSSTGRVKLDTPATGDLLITCEYDKKVRFDVDTFETEFNAFDDYTKQALYTISSIPIIELR
jgi:uncharacterized protein (TIGR02217 family)